MAIDIFNIQENVISKSLKGRFLCIYGNEKVGKSTFGAHLPRPLFCNFEVGTNYLPVKPVNIDKWSTFKLVLRQLEDPRGRETYDTVVIDTISEAYNSCEKFICSQNSVQKIGDIAYGRGYSDTKAEFESALRKITMMGYGLCCICHAEKKTIPGPGETTLEKYQPAMPSRAADVVNRMVDIIAYIDEQFDEKGESVKHFITRRTPTVLAGSRLPYLDAKIPFSYNDLIAAIERAIDKQQQLDGAQVSDVLPQNVAVDKLDFNAIMTEARQVWTTILDRAETDEDKQDAARAMAKKVELVFGHPMKLSEVTEDQCDLLNLALLDLKTLL